MLRLLQMQELKPGMVTAQPVVSATGKVLLEKGIFLTNERIDLLEKWNIGSVTIVMPDSVRSSPQYFFNLYQDTLMLVAEAFEQARAFNEVPVARCTELVENYIELIVNVIGVVDNIYKVQTRNEYTFQHLLNVAILSGIIGKWLGFKRKRLKEIILAGLLHDIGKTVIPESVLDKPGRLTNEEMAIVKTHPSHGYHLLINCHEIAEEVKLGVLQHHEREDGSGYPLGLKGKDIHIYAKIVMLADMYDAMSSERVYRAKMPFLTVIETLREQMYGKLNPQICLAFIANVSESLVGSSVLLNDGSKAKVIVINDRLGIRPMVRLENGHIIDLDKNRKLEIVALLNEIHTV